MRFSIYYLLIAIALSSSCRPERSDFYQINKVAEGPDGVVVSAHPLATQAGIRILEEGGNAADAAVAVEFALAVVLPRAGNLGGGGFAVSRTTNGDISVLDFREVAPSDAHTDMFLDDEGEVIKGASVFGHLASGVPGTVDGLLTLLDSMGSGMSLDQIMDPAILLAENGFRLTPEGAGRLNEYQREFKILHPKFSPFLKKKWLPGDVFIQSELAGTLKRIAMNGRDEFYSGLTASFIVKEMERVNGIINPEDLKGYESVWRRPLKVAYDEYTIYSVPPPSSGGIALIQLFEMLEPYDLRELGFHDTRSIHLMVEAERRVYADRATYLGDPGFVSMPLDSLMDSTYISGRMASFEWSKATPSDSIRQGFFKDIESSETTHLNVIDKDGNVIALTTTLNSSFGSKVYVTGAGFLMNNEMDDFSMKPGVPNQFGLLGNAKNAIAPGKRMLSSMSPTIVDKNGAFYMALGTPGGGKIITSVAQVLLNVIEFGLPIDSAVFAPRFHHQWHPDEIQFEAGRFHPDSLGKLNALRHSTVPSGYFGFVKAILRDGDNYVGVGDSRTIDHCQSVNSDK